jgi:hypothetical protein
MESQETFAANCRRLTHVFEQAPAPSADFSKSENNGLQIGQNFGTMEASFYSDSIRGINIAAGASVFMGRRGPTQLPLS